jgi:hypothetical protein
VRAVDPVIGPLITRGIEHSVTFRQLVAAIDGGFGEVRLGQG